MKHELGSIYKTRPRFEVARNESKQVWLDGIWHRHYPVEYVVIGPDGKPSVFDNLRSALALFEELTK